MTQIITATYQNGYLKSVQDIGLQEGQTIQFQLIPTAIETKAAPAKHSPLNLRNL